MRLTTSVLILYFFSTLSLNPCFGQDSTRNAVAPTYLYATWIIQQGDTPIITNVFDKLKLFNDGSFEQWREIDGKLSNKRKGKFTITESRLVFTEEKGGGNVFKIIQVIFTSIKLREKDSDDVFTLIRE